MEASPARELTGKKEPGERPGQNEVMGLGLTWDQVQKRAFSCEKTRKNARFSMILPASIPVDRTKIGHF